MGFGRFSVSFIALMLLVSTAATPSIASLNDTPRMTLLEQHEVDKWAEIPAQFHLTGQIVDDEGNPVRGVEILQVDDQNTRLLTKSGRNGTFDIEEFLSPRAQLILRHKMFAPRRIEAGSAYIGKNQPTSIEIIPYTERFDVSPQGGTYKSGQLTLEVPRGAVSTPVTILAAQLPLDFGYNHDGTVEPIRLTSVDLKPHGLKFAKPVTLTMTIDREDMDVITNPVSYYFDENKGHYMRDPRGVVEIDGHRISITLSHFSPHATADGRMAQSTQNLGRGTDVNGDGALTPSDALFMLLASGGTQSASANYSQTIVGSVREEHADGDAFTFKDQSYGVSPALKRGAALKVARAFSLGQQWEKPITASLAVEADEYGFECQLLVGTYDFHRGTRWERVVPTAAELSIIKAGWNSARDQGKMNRSGNDAPSGHFEYFKWQGANKPIITQSLPGTHTLAVTAGDEGLEVFTRGRSYTIARIRGAAHGPCPGQTEADLWASSDRAISGVRGRKAQQAAMARNFFFGETARAPNPTPSWGTFQRDTVQTYTDLRCVSRQHEVWSYAIDQSSGENEAVRMWTTPSVQSVEPGTRDETSIEWQISNNETAHFAEHITAGLFKQTPDGVIPFGFMLHRMAERPCEAAPAVHSEVSASNGSGVTALSRAPTYGLVSRNN